jgi:hypothetical protein
MTALVGSTDGVRWMVGLLLMLTFGLGAALLAATRSRPTRRF